VGYVVSGMKSTRQARIGDTIYSPSQWVGGKEMSPLEGYEPAKQMLYASVFPIDTLETDLLYSSVDRLCLNDSSVSVAKDQSLSLGSGLRCGFLGFLHMEVFMQRLRDEFNINVIMTSPSVPYIVQYGNGEIKHVSTVDEFPNTAMKVGDYKVY
jgi:translation elongation factor EF-4